MKAVSKKATKEVIVIATYHIKRSGATVYRVRSNHPSKDGYVEGRDQVERNGKWYDVYQVCVNDVYVCGCTCKASEYRGVCCHRKHVQGVINAKRVVVLPTQVDESPAVGSSQKRELPTKVTDISTKGALTTNKGFTLLKVS